MTSQTRRRMRSGSVVIGVTAVVAAGLTGCSSQSADYAAVCVDPETEQRVDDDQCDDDRDYTGVGTGFFWYYLAASSRVPAVASAVRGGTFNGSALSGRVQRGGLPTVGGGTVRSTTKTGGFGGSNRGFSG